MSLIVCKNKPTEDTIVSEVNNVNKPYSFRNSMTGNIEIPANAQIALQSAKINMDGSILVGEDRKIFYYYKGPQIDELDNTLIDNLTESPAYPIKVPLFEGSRLTRVTTFEIAQEIQKSLNKVVTSPNFKNRVKVTTIIDATGFKGYKFDFQERITAPDAVYAPTDNIPPANVLGQTTGMIEAGRTAIRKYQVTNGASGIAPSWEYVVAVGTGSFGVNTRRAVTRSAIGNVPPLNQKAGVYRVDISECLIQAAARSRARFMVGLSRGSRSLRYNVITGEPEPGPANAMIRPENYRLGNGSLGKPWMNTFADYAVMYDPTNSSGVNHNGRLRLVHSVVNRSDLSGPNGRRSGYRDRIKFQELKYGDGLNGSVNTGASADVSASAGFSPDYGYDLTNNPLSIDRIEFTLSGGQVTVMMISDAASGNNEYDLITYDAARNKETLFKCVNQNCECLLPVLAINNKDMLDDTGNPGTTQELSILRYDGVNSNWANFDFLSDDESKNDWINRTYTSDASAIIAARELDQERDFNNYTTPGNVGSPIDFNYPGLVFGALDFEFQKSVLITMPDNTYGGYRGISSEGANTSLYLGFDQLSHVEANTLVDASYQTSSISIPPLLSSKSVFVRLENFGQESINAYQGLRSKIIAHLPRFDGVNSVGPLYLEPNNMIYLDLKNPHPFKINSFDVSLCFTDETYAINLTGTTIICLHVREKPASAVRVN